MTRDAEQQDEQTTILLAGPGHDEDEATTILLADPGREEDEATTIMLAGPGYHEDERTTVVQAVVEEEPEDRTTIVPADSAGWQDDAAWPADADADSAVEAAAASGPEASALTQSGPVMPDYLDEEATTVSQAAPAEPEPAYITELMPAAAPAGVAEADRPWFDGVLSGFITALRQDEHGAPRPPEARQALAAAARDTIARVAMQGAPGAGWAADTVLQPDQLLANTYVVRALIARGGIGEIYRTRHRDLKTEHAIKILLPRYALDSTMLTLMLEEARLLQCVRHEAVVGCQDLLRDTDGRPMLVMDYLRGRTLSSRLREGRLPPADLLVLARRLAEGLAAIHAAGIVHQDVSPDNVILAEDSVAAATIIDFGLARRLGGARDVHRQLDFAGKFSWSSPEQLSGRPAMVDARSDLYSLGLMLAAAARGYRLEMGHDLESARAARSSVPSLAGIEQPLAGLLERLLTPTPGARLSAADEIPGLLARRPGMFQRWLGR